ncbi:MAG: glutathione S-transferase family protein [Rhodospirillales bacterium]|nr:glutathione S-transferase family protein [Rhodospirillales bacterium]
MTIEVYWGSGSPFAWSVLLALEAKRIPYESRLLSFSAGDTKKPAFLAINPRGKVPAIRDGAYTLAESIAILAYVDAKYPEPPLFGRAPEETGRIWQCISDGMSYLQPAAEKVIHPLFRGGIAGREDQVREGAREVEEELARLAAVLGDRPYLAADTLNAADLVIYPKLALFFRIAARDELKVLDLGFDGWRQRWPAIAGWFDRIAALPGFDRTYPPHWREG